MTFTGKRKHVLDVCEKRCDQCLFSKAKIVSDARRDDILRTLERDGTHFQCHKHSIAERDVVCRGDFDRAPHRTPQARMAAAFGLLRFITEDGTELPPFAPPSKGETEP